MSSAPSPSWISVTVCRLLTNGIGQSHAHIVATGRKWHVKRALTWLKTTRADVRRLLVDLTTVDLDPDRLDRIGGRLDHDLDDGAAAALRRAVAGASILNRGTGRDSSSVRWKVVPGASRTACSAEARMMDFSTMSGRLRCWRSCSAPTNSAAWSRPLVNLPADQLVGTGRPHVIALRSPKHPVAIGAVEKRDDQLTRYQVPNSECLIVSARCQETSIRRGRNGPNIAFVSDIGAARGPWRSYAAR